MTRRPSRNVVDGGCTTGGLQTESYIISKPVQRAKRVTNIFTFFWDKTQFLSCKKLLKQTKKNYFAPYVLIKKRKSRTNLHSIKVLELALLVRKRALCILDKFLTVFLNGSVEGPTFSLCRTSTTPQQPPTYSPIQSSRFPYFPTWKVETPNLTQCSKAKVAMPLYGTT